MILLDLLLPEMSGTEICRRLRRDPLTQDIPIVIITAKLLQAEHSVLFEMGADWVITKPFALSEVVARVNTLTNRL